MASFERFAMAGVRSRRLARMALFAVTAALTLAGASRAETHRRTGRLAANTPWENPFTVVDTGIAGPTLLVAAGLHGNEPAGFRAAEQIRHWPIARGRLIVVPRVNAPGLRQNTRWLPGLPEEVRNANRNFPNKDGPNEAKTVPVAALWQFVQDQKPDWVVDLHEGFDFHVANPKSDGSSIIYLDSPAMRPIAENIHTAVNAAVEKPDRRFVCLSQSGPVAGGLVRAAVDRLGASGFIFETTYSRQPISTRTRQHRIMVHCLMRQLGMAAGDATVLTGEAESTRTRVALYDAGGTGGRGVVNLRRILESDETFALHHVGPPEIRSGVLGQFDVVVFPGGSGSKEAAALGADGRKAVKDFVDAGGGFVGICAGAYLATAKYDWSLGLVNAKTFTGRRPIPGVGERSMWFRGTGDMKMELTERGKAILGDVPGTVELWYANGPILSPAADENLPEYVPLAVFRTEVSKYEPQRGTMVNTPAIIAAQFGRGRAIAVSPHPELTGGLESLVVRAVKWAAGDECQREEPSR